MEGPIANLEAGTRNYQGTSQLCRHDDEVIILVPEERMADQALP
jgi:hypothetical protein